MKPISSRHLYLASRSPRRLELLRQIGIEPTLLPTRVSQGRTDVDETPLPRESPRAYVLRLAKLKAEAGHRARMDRNLPPWPILAADTTVVVDRRILGKPAHVDEAAAMLRAYSGRTHRVLTAVALAHDGFVRSAVSISNVRFRELGEHEIQAYVSSREVFDKAGGYGIQGRAAAFIQHLSGSYSGVMGLPLFETSELLKSVGFDIL